MLGMALEVRIRRLRSAEAVVTLISHQQRRQENVARSPGWDRERHWHRAVCSLEGGLRSYTAADNSQLATPHHMLPRV